MMPTLDDDPGDDVLPDEPEIQDVVGSDPGDGIGDALTLDASPNVLEGFSALSDLRTAVMTLLSPPEDVTEWTVADGVVDAFVPPGFLVTWGDGWVQPKTHCYANATLDVVVIAERFEPESGTTTLEQLVALAFSQLAAGALVPRSVSPPGRFDIGGIVYLAAHLSIVSPVSLGGS